MTSAPASLSLAPVRLRRATMADFGAIARIESLCFERPQERLGVRTLRTLLRNPRADSFVAVTDSAPAQCLGWAVGFVWSRFVPPWGRIYAVAVHPQGRGLGIGRLLMDQLVTTLRQRGAKTIYLEVRQDNPAIALYQKLGFEACDTLPNYYGLGLHATRMMLE